MCVCLCLCLCLCVSGEVWLDSPELTVARLCPLQLEVAGPLYLRARRWVAASQCFEQVDNFGRALKILDEQELYDQAMDCLQRYNIRTQVRPGDNRRG